MDTATKTDGTAKVERDHFWAFCHRAIANSKNKAWRLKIPHSITAYNVDQLLVDQRYRCAVSGIELETPNVKPAGPFGPSLDRITPSLGYVHGNVRVTCLIVNLAMNKWGEQALRKLVSDMNYYYGN